MATNSKHTILIVEDNDINLMILEEMLQDAYQLLTATNGQEGMEQLHAHYKDIDVVLLDIEMPVMNGYQVLEAKKQEPLLRDIPVIITTGSDAKQEEIHCLELGANDFVRKPYDPIVVQLRIESIIKLRESTEANRQKALFIQNISHEIRTPMNAIMGFSQILETADNDLEEEERSMFFNQITCNSRNLMSMIDNMLLLSDFDSSLFAVQLHPEPINQVCQLAMEEASYCTPEGVAVNFTTDVPDNYRIKTDGKYVQQALVNYLLNACKFTMEGEIVVSCSNQEKQGYITLSVTDTGCGVPADQAEHIFERFAKLDAFVPGMGLGLSIAKKIAVFLGGAAYLDASHQPGARFVLEIPIVE